MCCERVWVDGGRCVRGVPCCTTTAAATTAIIVAYTHMMTLDFIRVACSPFTRHTPTALHTLLENSDSDTHYRVLGSRKVRTCSFIPYFVPVGIFFLLFRRGPSRSAARGMRLSAGRYNTDTRVRAPQTGYNSMLHMIAMTAIALSLE